MAGEAKKRIVSPSVIELAGAAIGCGIGGGVSVPAIGARVEKGRTALPAHAGHQLARCSLDGEDVVPVERFETDPGPDPELDPLRESLGNVFEGLDEYADVQHRVERLRQGLPLSEILDVE